MAQLCVYLQRLVTVYSVDGTRPEFLTLRTKLEEIEIFLLALAGRSPLARFFRSFADEARLDELVIGALALMHDSLAPFANKSLLEVQMMPPAAQKQVEELKEMRESVSETSSTYFPSNPLKLDVILNRNRQAALMFDDVMAALSRTLRAPVSQLCLTLHAHAHHLTVS